MIAARPLPRRERPRPARGWVVAAALVGLAAGWVAGYGLGRPSAEEIRAAAETAVLPDATVIDRGSGGSDWNPLRSAYTARVDFALPDIPAEEVVQRARRAVEAAGWRIVGTEEPPAGTVLHIERRVLRGSVHLRYRFESADDGRVFVRRRHEGIQTTAWAGGAIGAVLAALLWWGLAAMAARRAA